MSDTTIHQGQAHEPLLTGAKADVHRLLVALVKLALVDEVDAPASWRADALQAQKLVADASEGLHALRLDTLWDLAVKDAARDPVVRRDERINPTLPTLSPLSLDRLAATPFDLAAAVQSIRDVASFG